MLDSFVLLIVPQWDSYEAMEHQQQGAPPHFAFLFVHCWTDLFLVGGLVVEDQQKGVCVIYFFYGGGEEEVGGLSRTGSLPIKIKNLC